MRFRKIMALILACVFVAGAVATMAGCNTNNGGDVKKDEPPKSKRTNVFGGTEVEIPEDMGYVQNFFYSDKELFMTFSTDYTAIVNAEGEEVERRKGYFWQENGGVNWDYDYGDDEVIIYDTYEPVETKPATDTGMDVEGEDNWNKHVDVVTPGSDDTSLLLPDKWELRYYNILSVCIASLEKNADGRYSSRVIDLDLGYGGYDDKTGGSNMGSSFVDSDGNLVILAEHYQYGSGYYGDYGYPEDETETEEFGVDDKADIEEPIDVIDDYSYRHWYVLDTVDLATGKLKESRDLTEAFKNAGVNLEETWVQQVVCTSDGTLALVMNSDVMYIGKDGSYLGKTTVDGWVNKIVSMGNGFMILYSDDMGNMKYERVDNGKGSPMNLDLDGHTYYDVLAASDEKLFFYDEGGITLYDLTTGKLSEYLNFINCDMDYFGGNVAGILNDGRVIFINNRWGGGIIYDTAVYRSSYKAGGYQQGKMTVEIYERIPDEQMAEEVLVTIGSAVSDYNLVRTMIRFNKKNTGVRVQLQSYEKYNDADSDWKGGYDQFNKDLSTGKVPDIIFMNSQMPVDSLYRNKVFEDLTRYVEALDQSKYLTNIFDATKVGEKMYSIILTYSVQTMFAKSKFVGTEPGWTFERFMQVLNTMPEGMEAFWGLSRDEIMNLFFGNSLDSLVNWDTGETEFETQGFIDFIKYLKNCREKNIYTEFYESMGDDYDEEKYREFNEKTELKYFRDEALIENYYVSSMVDLLYLQQTFATKDITAIGYPTRSGNGMLITPQCEMAIGARSKAKDQAWEFIKFMLDDDEFYSSYWGFTVNRENMDEKARNAKDNWWDGDYIDEWTLNWWKEAGYSQEYIDYQTARNVKFSEEAVQQMYDLIKGATMVSRTDPGLVEIIKDELSSFFGGTKSAEETARIIAGRARTYISEHS